MGRGVRSIKGPALVRSSGETEPGEHPLTPIPLPRLVIARDGTVPPFLIA